MGVVTPAKSSLLSITISARRCCRQAAPGDFAILFRTGPQARVFEAERVSVRLGGAVMTVSFD